MTPAEVLRDAARRVRVLAKDATPGAWLAVPHDRTGHVDDSPTVWDDLPDEDNWDADADADIEYVSLAMGSTLPAERGGALRMPGSYEPQHELIEYELGQVSAEQQAEAVASIRWIAALSPAVAEPLAAWLDYAADRSERGLADATRPFALALADALGVGGEA